MRARQTVQKYFNLAYLPSREGMRYEELPGDGKTKTVVESIGAVLALYASYSELSEKFLKAFSLEQSHYTSGIGRVVTCGLGIFVCLHILFARKPGSSNVLGYSKIPRLLAGLIFWLVLVSLGMTIYDLINQPRTSLGLPSASYELPAKECQATNNPGPSEAATSAYACRVAIPPEYQGQYRDLKVSLVPTGNFTLESVAPAPKEGIVVPLNQEPLASGNFDKLSSAWVFPQFDPNKDWKLVVTLDKTKVKGALPNQPPIRIIVTFHK